MSMRLAARRIPQGRDAASIRKWAMIFLTVGIIGQGIIQNRLLHMNSVSGDELLAAMEQSPMVMPLLTAALVCKVVETCAAPLFAFLLVEGFQRTRSFEKYLLRVGAVALVSELPYNLAYGGKLFELSSRNPVFGLFICMVMLFFYARYEDKGLKNTAMKALITVAAFLWCLMLHIDQGICLVIMTAILWYARARSNGRSVLGFCGAMFCTVFDMYYIGSGLACIMLHRYNEERGEQNEKLNYAFYPVVLLIVGIIGLFI
ncbi:MAG: hypothetical protein IJY40_10170 [Oscillospiraceae bacterium]|nr:hypothetical protein [Oscillospiraceae bacterium]